MKKCRICRSDKPLDQFYHSKSGADGYRTECKKCNDSKKRLWDKDNYSHRSEIRRCAERRRRRERPEYYRAKNRIHDHKRQAKKTIYMREKRRRDLPFRIASIFRSRLCNELKGRVKPGGGALKLLGCSLDSFRIYIESKFETGMSWENYGRGAGKWHIDHEMPCAIFDLTNEEHRKRCFHFSNLQPMWGNKNVAKGRKITNPQFNLL